MSDFLTRRCGTWHFVRRVPIEFAHLDERGIIKHSTKVRIAQDRTGRRAARVAGKLNDELELYWKSLADGRSKADLSGYDEARRRARSLGFEYIENAQLLDVASGAASRPRRNPCCPRGHQRCGRSRRIARNGEAPSLPPVEAVRRIRSNDKR